MSIKGWDGTREHHRFLQTTDEHWGDYWEQVMSLIFLSL